jgi:hypothetical protein
MTDVSNADLMGVLLTVKEDIGGLKSTCALQLEGLKNHAERIVKLEDVASQQKGRASLWALIAAGAGAIAGSVPVLAKLLMAKP